MIIGTALFGAGSLGLWLWRWGVLPSAWWVGGFAIFLILLGVTLVWRWVVSARAHELGLLPLLWTLAAGFEVAYNLGWIHP